MFKYSSWLTALLLGHLTSLAGASQLTDAAIGEFNIVGFSVSGDAVFGKPRIDQMLASFVGKGRHFSDIQSAVENLQAAYSATGGAAMLKVQLPAQELNGGVIQLNVIGSLPSSGSDGKKEEKTRDSGVKKDDGAKKAEDGPAKKIYCN